MYHTQSIHYLYIYLLLYYIYYIVSASILLLLYYIVTIVRSLDCRYRFIVNFPLFKRFIQIFFYYYLHSAYLQPPPDNSYCAFLCVFLFFWCNIIKLYKDAGCCPLKFVSECVCPFMCLHPCLLYTTYVYYSAHNYKSFSASSILC